MLSRMKFAIEQLVQEILDQLPKSVWTSTVTTFCDPAFGGGQFVKAIEARLRAAGHSDTNIRSRVFGFEASELHVRWVQNKYKLVGQYSKMPYNKFFELDNNMKFDVIVGNPPYQNNNSKATSGKLWPKFVAESFRRVTEGGHVALVVPNSWTKGNIAPNGSGSILTVLASQNLIAVSNMDCGKYFPNVGVNFSYFVCQNSLPNQLTSLTQNGKTIEIDFSKVYTLPKEINALPIINKFYRGGKVVDHILVTNTRNCYMDLADTGIYKVVTNGKVTYTDSKKYDTGEKIIIPWANDLKKTCMGNYVAGDSSLVFKTNGKAAELWSVLNSKLYRFCCIAVRMANHNEGARNYPEVPLTKVYTDSELYTHFGLTQEEIDYVEANVK